MSLDRETFTSDAYGIIEINRYTGGDKRDLFQVDYPTGGGITITIRHAEVGRDLSRDWVYGRDVVCEVRMSEVQFARAITAMNTGGTPCTLKLIPKAPYTLYTPELPDYTMGRAEKLHEEIESDAKKAMEGVNASLARMDAMLAGGPVTKKELKEVRDALWMAQKAVTDSLPFAVKTGHEQIEKAVDKAKAEINAYAEAEFKRLGMVALAERQMITEGAKPEPFRLPKKEG